MLARSAAALIAALVAFGFGGMSAKAFVQPATVNAPTTSPADPADSAPSANAPSETTASASAALREYLLGAGDKLRVIVFGEESLSGEFVLDGGGRLAMPLVGTFEAAGRTTTQLEADLAARLRNGFLQNPRVAIEIGSYRPFYILGEVEKPGEYPFANGLTVLNAVATAGGFAPLSDRTRVFVRRAGAVQEELIPIAAATPVLPGDTIRIAKGAFYILGEVNSPGEYPFTDGLTVMNAVASAKGFTYRAQTRRVAIKRAGEEVERRENLTASLRVGPGDTIRVLERWF